MPQTALVMMAASQVAGGVSGYQAGRAQAKESMQQAGDARGAGLFQEEQDRTQADVAMGAAAARAGASGVTLAGSPLQVMARQQAQYELEAQAARYQGLSEARAYTAKAGMEKFGATSALFQGITSAGSTAWQGRDNFLTRAPYTAKPWLVPSGESISSGPSVRL